MNINIFKIIGDADIVVKLILLLLVAFSVFSWAIIFYKLKTLKAADRQSGRFLEAFRRSKSLTEVNEAAKKLRASPLAVIFLAGNKELAYQSKSSGGNGWTRDQTESLSRALLKASNSEVSRLEKMMFFLATTGSVSPFIGLFGTVWGIMISFMRIGAMRSASLQVVAPGIAEALIATAVGLFAAVPAVIAYNYFLGRIKDLIAAMDDFSLEFLSISERLHGS
ncbi:MAG TPA: protein TolQ [Candidatus Aminicenantes bacterium]|nr:protein TolQ [Candidatus Aminicenantes bacterium]HRY64356.1 protein TolQ [Candidatus Aminicenantes bacterium]HRZ71269.1 protein TolQ [Candidatus Aminicenantes bacterium]